LIAAKHLSDFAQILRKAGRAGVRKGFLQNQLALPQAGLCLSSSVPLCPPLSFSPQNFKDNSEKNSEFFRFRLEITKLCPKSANLPLGTVNNSELAVN
jgi:hypothetical protein